MINVRKLTGIRPIGCVMKRSVAVATWVISMSVYANNK